MTDAVGADGDRLPPLAAEQMTDEQRAAAAEIISGPRGELVGPFVPLLRSPHLMRRLQQTGEQLRFHTVLAAPLLEMCILLVAREWDQRFEWRYHCPLALRAGIAPEVIRAINERRHPDGLAADAEAVWRVCEELHRTRRVTGRRSPMPCESSARWAWSNSYRPPVITRRSRWS